MKQLTIREAADFLLRNDNYVLLTHRRPDGDTIGSAAPCAQACAASARRPMCWKIRSSRRNSARGSAS